MAQHKVSGNPENYTINPFLPMTRQDMSDRGWDSCDFIIISGDAYVDHPAFGTALIARVLEAEGYRVGIIAQPSWKSCADFEVLGCPDLAFLVTSGNLDSMVSHYTSSGKPRSQDAYSPGGMGGNRPDRALIPYVSRIKQAYKGVPVIIGGLEASLRRLSHYDFWSDKVRRSMLLDSKADMLIFGMAESTIIQIAACLKDGRDLAAAADVRGTVFTAKPTALPDSQWETASLPSYHEVSSRDKQSNQAAEEAKKAYAESVHLRLLHENPIIPTRLIEEYETSLVVQNPPALPLDRKALDALYDLPFTREYHPCYRMLGGVPALDEVKFSITANRGCFGSCSFCAITSHQGRVISSRSHESILREARKLTEMADFKGYIHDIGGPTANFRARGCRRQNTAGPCPDKMCLFPETCGNLIDSHEDFLILLNKVRSLPKVKKVFIKSGIRYDYLLSAPEKIKNRFIRELAKHHVSGQLKVAPEHVSPAVLDIMGKPSIKSFNEFSRLFAEANRSLGKKQYIIPYFISGHPGSRLKDAVMLAEFMHDYAFIPDQVQDFYPTPGTVASCIYFSGLDPRPGKNFTAVYVPKGREKKLQRALLHFHKPENRKQVIEALKTAGRTDLIGFGPACLIKPPSSRTGPKPGSNSSSRTTRDSSAKRKKHPGKRQGTAKKKSQSHRSH